MTDSANNRGENGVWKNLASLEQEVNNINVSSV